MFPDDIQKLLDGPVNDGSEAELAKLVRRIKDRTERKAVEFFANEALALRLNE